MNGDNFRQSDLDGLSSAVSTAVIYTLDTTAPVAPNISLAVDTGQPGVAATLSDGITSNPTVNVSGLESGASWMWNIGFNDPSLSAANLATATTWLTQQGLVGWKIGSGNTFNLLDFQGSIRTGWNNGTLAPDESDPVSLVLGSYYRPGLPVSITIRQTDAAGNVGDESSARVFQLDNVAGHISIPNLFDDNVVKTIRIRDGSIWQWKTLQQPLDGSIPDPGTNGWANGSGNSVDVSKLGTGDFVVYIREVDLPGNLDPSYIYISLYVPPVMP